MANEFDIKEASNPIVDFIELYGAKNIRKQLDKIMRDAGFGSFDTINYLSMRGINYLRQGHQQVRSNRDNMGYVFFTRPILNLTYDNLTVTETMMQLRSTEPMSYQRMIRAILDPWGQWNLKSAGNVEPRRTLNNVQSFDQDITIADNNERGSPLVDPCNPFISFLSNYLLSLSGWRDVSLNAKVSTAGIHNEQYSVVDGFYHKTEAFELSASFRNIEGDPISTLFQYWEEYMINCREGIQNPYPIFIEDREYDYMTRIYRFIMDHTKTYITKWASTIAWPASIPTGNQFNYQSDKNFVDANAEIPVTFNCIGAEYNNPVLFYEFNRLVAMFCPALKVDYTKYDSQTNSLVVVGQDQWRKLKSSEKNRGNMRAIPLINYRTQELEWWVRNSDYVQHVLEPAEIQQQQLSQRNEVEKFGEVMSQAYTTGLMDKYKRG